ncbi:MAG: protein-disulfide reductase DsbD family protein, partial [Chitinophagaceae bacterium]
TLPSSWSTKADTKAGLGNFFGIFFMALTLSIVSFSCTGPIIGNLLVLAAGGGKSGPLVGMFGFSLALAIPFALFAIFPSWLNKIGKAGGWLNSVKVVLGLLELALALKFLSNVDMAYHWNILSREVFLAIWIVIFAIIGFYLLGKIKFHNDSEVKHVSVARLFFAIASFAFMVYLIPGLFGAELKGVVAGFLPSYSSFSQPASFSGGGEDPAPANVYDGITPVKYVNLFAKSTPTGYTAFYDYNEAIAAARKLKKPVMIDFTGWSCVNCRKMESEVWTNPAVKNEINKDFVLLQLYVDEKHKLPDSLQYYSKILDTKITTLGLKNTDFEATHFNRNSQPYYVLLDQNGNMLTDKGYSAQDGYDPAKFLSFLEKADAEYHKRNS